MNGLLLLIVILCPFIFAPISYICGRKNVKLMNFTNYMCIGGVLIISGFLLSQVINGQTLNYSLDNVCGMGISLKLDGFRAIHGVLASFMWLCSFMFSREYSVKCKDEKQARYSLFNLLTFGAVLGVFLSSDLFSIFIFFEIMSFTSYMWVLHDETEKSKKAAETYLGVSIICGMIMLMGLFLLYTNTGTLQISELYEALKFAESKSAIYLAGLLILVGFGAKAGMYPLHIWMPKTYPAAPAPASALLSGILSKAGVYGIIVISSSIFIYDEKWGLTVLILGTVTMFWGGILALFSVNIKKIISCSSMSQIGFILVGIGMQGLLGEENALAVRGTVLHMINHSLIKLVLFIFVGIIFMNTKEYNLNKLKGYGKGKPVLLISYLLAALGIMGVPFFNGYVSKTLLHESIVEYVEHLNHLGMSSSLYTVIEWVFLISGGITIAYILKIFIAIFVDKPAKQSYVKKSKYISVQTGLSILVPALIMPLIGIIPNITADSIADLGQGIMQGHAPEHSVNYFSFINIKGALISITIGVLIYLIVVRKLLCAKNKFGRFEYMDKWPKYFDLETMLYRPLFEVLLPGLLGGISVVMDRYIVDPLYKVAMTVLSGYAAVTSSSVDVAAAKLQKTVYAPISPKEKVKIHNPISFVLGKIMDEGSYLYNKYFHHGRYVHPHFANSMSHMEEESSVRRRVIAASLSYGLMFSGLGLVIVLIYLLLA